MKKKTTVLSIRIPTELRAAIDAEVRTRNKQRKTGLLAQVAKLQGKRLETVTRVDVLAQMLQDHFSPYGLQRREIAFHQGRLSDALFLLPDCYRELARRLRDICGTIKKMPLDGKSGSYSNLWEMWNKDRVEIQSLTAEITQELSSWHKALSTSNTSEAPLGEKSGKKSSIARVGDASDVKT